MNNKTIKNFKNQWPGYLEMVYSDKEIEEWLNSDQSLEICIDRATDYMLAQGLGDVQD